MLGILARVGQNAFRGGIVNHWWHSEMSTWKHQPRPCIPRAVLAAERRHSLAHQRDAQVRLLESQAMYGRVRDGFGDSDPWKVLCDLTPQPEDVAVW